MKENITESVEQCSTCHGYFVIGLEGEGKVCDKCKDETQPTPWEDGELAL